LYEVPIRRAEPAAVGNNDGQLQDRLSSNPDHNVRRLDYRDSIGSGLQCKIIDSLVRNRRCDYLTSVNIDSNVLLQLRQIDVVGA
jgi:hypothetical protein